MNIYSLGVKNLFASLISQAVALISGVVLSFALPAYLGIEQFGYWQVYLLYVSFAMLFGLGFTDGIYLRYGAYNYGDLPYNTLRSTLRVYFITAVIFTAALMLITQTEPYAEKRFALMSASFNIFLLLLSNAAVSVLQFTNRIREYSFVVAAGKMLLLALVLLVLVLGVRNFKAIIAVDIFTKLVLLSLNIWLVRKVFVGKAAPFSEGLRDWYRNILTGSKMMLSVYASTLVLNIGRILIERSEEVTVFSSYAFAVSISSFFLVFVTTSSLSFYPFLKRVDQASLPSIYNQTNAFLFFISYAMLLLYYPLSWIISRWYHEYTAILSYFPFFLIMTLMQGKEHFLNTVYLKALREEGRLLVYNIVFSVLALATILPVYYLTHSVYAVALTTCLLVVLKSYSFEFYLRKRKLHLHFSNILHEIPLMILFLIVTNYSNTITGLAVFLVVLFVMFVSRRTFYLRFLKRMYKEFKSS